MQKYYGIPYLLPTCCINRHQQLPAETVTVNVWTDILCCSVLNAQYCTIVVLSHFRGCWLLCTGGSFFRVPCRRVVKWAQSEFSTIFCVLNYKMLPTLVGGGQKTLLIKFLLIRVGDLCSLITNQTLSTFRLKAQVDSWDFVHVKRSPVIRSWTMVIFSRFMFSVLIQ